MKVVMHIEWDEMEFVWLLNLIARRNGRLLRTSSTWPWLYDSGVIYRPEKVETFRDVRGCLDAGAEDCDSLSAWRAGELLARGWQALRPGDAGYAWAQQHRPESIPAEVMLQAWHEPEERGPMHAVTRYRCGQTVHVDDPSSRLGMFGGQIAPDVWERWARAGVRERVVTAWAARGVKLRVKGGRNASSREVARIPAKRRSHG